MIKYGNNTTVDGELMTNLSMLLEYLDEDINEAAISADKAASENLAVYVFKMTNDGAIFIYDPATLLQHAQNELSRRSPNLKKLLNKKFIQAASKGEISFQKSPDCDSDTYQVITSFAINKYGPLIYDIVLSYIYPNYVISDRGSVSDAAQSVWQYYLKNRPDVTKKLIKSIGDSCNLPDMGDNKKFIAYTQLMNQTSKLKWDLQYTRDKQAKEKIKTKIVSNLEKAKTIAASIPTAYKYKIKSPIDISTLQNNHKNFVLQLRNLVEQSPNVSKKDKLDFKNNINQSIASAFVD